MKVSVKYGVRGCSFANIEKGEVFYGDDRPDIFFLRTDDDKFVAVDIEKGVLYQHDDFVYDDILYHIVKAEVTIS